MTLFNFFKTKKLVPVVPYEQIYKELETFTEASLAMPKMNNPFLLDDESKHPMIFGYFIGAIDHIAQAYALSEKDTSTIIMQYVSHNFGNNNNETTTELLKYCEEVKQRDDVGDYALRGKLAMKKWRAGGPMAEYAPMSLIKILND